MPPSQSRSDSWDGLHRRVICRHCPSNWLVKQLCGMSPTQWIWVACAVSYRSIVWPLVQQTPASCCTTVLIDNTSPLTAIKATFFPLVVGGATCMWLTYIPGALEVVGMDVCLPNWKYYTHVSIKLYLWWSPRCVFFWPWVV